MSISQASVSRRQSTIIGPTVGKASKRIIVTAVLLAVIFAPYIGVSGYITRTIMLVGVLGLLTSGLNIVLGYAGELAVSQVFLYAAGAYVTAYLGVVHGVTDILIIAALVILTAVLIGLASGVPGLRLGGWSLAMVSFFMVLTIPSFVTVLKKFTAGPLGLSPPLPSLFGNELTQNGIYVLVVVVVSLWFVIARNLVLSRHGNAFLVLRQSPILASSIGISVFRLKLIVYVIGAVPCALAGALFAWIDGFVSPDSFTFALALSILAASVFGGATSIYGALLGAGLLQFGKQTLTGFQEWELIVYGVFLIAAVVLLRNGVAGLANQMVALVRSRGWIPQTATSISADEAGTISDSLVLPGKQLHCSGVSKNFGGIQALDDVSLDAEAGQVTALIGPNGSGKTTLLNIICGYYTPSAGEISFGSSQLSGAPAFQVARHGLARTFQTPMVTSGMSTLAFVAAGRYTQHSTSMFASILRLPTFRKSYRADDVEAMRLLGLLGIQEVADVPVDSLPLGTRRLAEVARTLASGAGAYLFDEVASGLDQADLDRLKSAIRVIKEAGGTVVLVEHNFPLVLEISDTIHVLSRGAVLASGSPDQIQQDPKVLAEYVGGSRNTDGADLQSLEDN